MKLRTLIGLTATAIATSQRDSAGKMRPKNWIAKRKVRRKMAEESRKRNRA